MAPRHPRRGWILLAACLSLMLLPACAGPPTTAPLPSATVAEPVQTLAPPTPLPSATAAPTAVPGGLFVDAAQALGPISPLLYGSNYGPWVAVTLAMLEPAYQSGTTVIRFPGGAWGDRNNVTPLQLDQFADFLARMGAVGSISVRLRDSTPEVAAEMVRYTNIEKGYNIRYWSIGNEPTLFAAEVAMFGQTYDTVRFNEEWRDFAQAMKAVDPSIQLVGPEVHQFTADANANPKDEAGRDWMIEFLRANGDLVDIISIHRYPFPRGQDNAIIANLRANSAEWDDIIPYLRQLVHTETGRDLPIAVTEINSHWNKAISGEATPDSHYNAIWLADVLGRMARNGVFMVNHWLLTSQGGQGGWGLLATSEVRPSYHIYQLYKKFGEERIVASSDDDAVSIYAARRSDGALTLVLINLSSEPVTKTLMLDNFAPGAAAETWLFDSEHAAVQVEPTALAAASEISLPPESMMLLVVEPG